jgi:hypothetical protein
MMMRQFNRNEAGYAAYVAFYEQITQDGENITGAFLNWEKLIATAL